MSGYSKTFEQYTGRMQTKHTFEMKGLPNAIKSPVSFDLFRADSLVNPPATIKGFGAQISRMKSFDAFVVVVAEL